MLVSRALDDVVSPVEPDGAFADYYRCPREHAAFGVTEGLSPVAGFFRFEGATGYGRFEWTAGKGPTPDVSGRARLDGTHLVLPFDLAEVVANLRQERYCEPSAESVWQGLYYFLRPHLSVPVRRHLQRFRLSGWERIPFPRWPVDVSVETLMASVMRLQLEATGTRIPFIWFWPEGAPGCAIMTHDVESLRGRDFCDRLMDLDDSCGLKAAFHVVPEVRYQVTDDFLDRFRLRGFEINVHDLNHDGRLFRSREQFFERAARINEYGRKFRSRGFRTGTMYRRQEWFNALEFSYDMSVPNVAHLEPQRGGCCTVTPYFLGDLIELPLTTVQDYSLFHILGDYSISLWKTQAETILARNGLITFVTHPDYLIDRRARAVYVELLDYIQELRDRARVWCPLPGEVERWWRNRSRMSLVRAGDRWRIEGPDANRARVAFAQLEDDRVVYSF